MDNNRDFRNRNETDFEEYNRFTIEQKQYDSLMEKERKERERKYNLKKIKEKLELFDESLPNRYKGISLKNLYKQDNPDAKKIVKTLTQKGTNNYNVFIIQDNVVKREKNIYGIIRDYIEMGVSDIDEISFFSEQELITQATTGFSGYSEYKEKTKNTRIFIIQGFKRTDYTAKEIRLFDEILYDCFHNDKILIIGSSINLANYKNFLNDESYQYLLEIIDKNVVML